MRKAWAIGLFFGWSLLLPNLHAQPTASQAVGPRPSQIPRARIGLIADAQYCDIDAEKGRYYRLSLEKLAQAVDTFNARKVDFVVNLGDLVDQRLGSYIRPMRILDRLEMPLQNVLGNHEFWDVPFLLQASLLDTLSLSSGYCAQELPGWRLLFLDGTELAAYAQGAHRELADEAEACRNSLEGQSNGAIWNGAIGEAQMLWMRAQLSEADRLGEHVLLFCHFPIAPAGHPMTLWNEADLRLLIDEFESPVAWIAGHSHTGDYLSMNQIHHLTLSGMLMTPDSNAFAILNIYEDRLVLEGFGREPSRVLPLRQSLAQVDVIYPTQTERPDAAPSPEIPCVDRSFYSPMGFLVFSEMTDSLAAQRLPRLKPGYYGARSFSNGKYQFSRHAVLPK